MFCLTQLQVFEVTQWAVACVLCVWEESGDKMLCEELESIINYFVLHLTSSPSQLQYQVKSGRREDGREL